VNRPALLKDIYKRLSSFYGPQRWWPADTPFEMMVGAILTQNTSWSNAARAIENLRKARLLDPGRLSRVSEKRLARLIRSSGYFRQKASRLKIFSRYLSDAYGGKIERMKRIPLDPLRKELLDLPGIGPETADSMLLYALGKPSFVVDAYTRRVLARHSLIPWRASYDEIQRFFVQGLPPKAPLFNKYHALLVAVGKDLCRKHPQCQGCPLRRVGKLRLEVLGSPLPG